MHVLFRYDMRSVFVDCAVLYSLMETATKIAMNGIILYRKSTLLVSKIPAYRENTTGWSTNAKNATAAVNLFSLVLLFVSDMWA